VGSRFALVRADRWAPLRSRTRLSSLELIESAASASFVSCGRTAATLR